MNLILSVKEGDKQVSFDLNKEDYWRKSAEELGVLLQKQIDKLL